MAGGRWCQAFGGTGGYLRRCASPCHPLLPQRRCASPCHILPPKLCRPASAYRNERGARACDSTPPRPPTHTHTHHILGTIFARLAGASGAPSRARSRCLCAPACSAALSTRTHDDAETRRSPAYPPPRPPAHPAHPPPRPPPPPDDVLFQRSQEERGAGGGGWCAVAEAIRSGGRTFLDELQVLHVHLHLFLQGIVFGLCGVEGGCCFGSSHVDAVCWTSSPPACLFCGKGRPGGGVGEDGGWIRSFARDGVRCVLLGWRVCNGGCGAFCLSSFEEKISRKAGL